MNKTDLIWFLIAGLVGAVGGYERTTTGNGVVRYGRSLAWAIVALFAFLGLIKAIVV